jgi:hypothetical protein
MDGPIIHYLAVLTESTLVESVGAAVVSVLTEVESVLTATVLFEPHATRAVAKANTKIAFFINVSIFI